MVHKQIVRRTGIIHALDVTTFDKAKHIAVRVAPYVDAIKITLPLILREGADVISNIGLEVEVPIIADLKVADIELTSTTIVKSIITHGANGVTFIGMVGADVMQSCIEEAHKHHVSTFIVTELSNPGAVRFMHRNGKDIARMAKKLGSDGIVAPATRPDRVKEYRKIIGKDVMIMSPGIGIQGGRVGDAIKAGADFEVIGRSIYDADDPEEAARRFAEILTHRKTHG